LRGGLADQLPLLARERARDVVLDVPLNELTALRLREDAGEEREELVRL
jgi:hypothetical protein